VLVRRFASRGVLNAPWGVARATQHFGPFSGDILIGNFGSWQTHRSNRRIATPMH
jgi:hypothetical protein